MSNITISKKEYQELVRKAVKYEYVKEVIAGREDVVGPPPTKDIKKVIKAFRDTKKYSPEFVESLEEGLRRSSHFRASQ